MGGHTSWPLGAWYRMGVTKPHLVPVRPSPSLIRMSNGQHVWSWGFVGRSVRVLRAPPEPPAEWSVAFHLPSSFFSFSFSLFPNNDGLQPSCDHWTQHLKLGHCEKGTPGVDPRSTLGFCGDTISPSLDPTSQLGPSLFPVPIDTSKGR